MILTVDYFAAKHLVELYGDLTAIAGRAIEHRRTALATGLNALLNAEANAYIEAQRVVQQHDREETERVTRRMQGQTRDRFEQLMLACPQVL